MKVYWTDRAKYRLRLIHDYIAQDAPLVASEVVARLLQRSRLIGELPYAGRQMPDTHATIFAKFSNDPTVSFTACCRTGSIL